MSASFDADAPFWELPIANFAVNWIEFGGGLLLRGCGSHEHGVSSQHCTKITLSTVFSFVSRDGAHHELDGGGDWAHLVPIFDLRHAIITTATAHQDGVLALAFSTGATLTAPPHVDGYEAWQVAGPDRLLVIGVGGPGVAIWGLDDA